MRSLRDRAWIKIEEVLELILRACHCTRFGLVKRNRQKTEERPEGGRPAGRARAKRGELEGREELVQGCW